MQKEKLDKMLSTRAKLQQQSAIEQQRFNALQSHIDSMDKNVHMQCSLGLQNLSGMKAILQGLSVQQHQQVKQSQNDEHRQQQACLKQMSFTKGINGIIDNRALLAKQGKEKQEQKQLDEMISQAYIHKLYK